MFLLLDVFLDDRQGCASAGGGEVGRGPKVPVHDGLVDPAGELLAEQTRRDALASIIHVRAPA